MSIKWSVKSEKFATGAYIVVIRIIIFIIIIVLLYVLNLNISLGVTRKGVRSLASTPGKLGIKRLFTN